ncbi:hemolysin III family protein [Amaricoccus sp.]|uniref:PAQR family membrane homeostasis protein TrhA n=1 Tax=Amaricoccus sp. TaxID=1872485 RepID=UPI00261679E7|nr:hemolysin III family protein [Amaricoccus sp.]HRO12888.1 hemolysin III family protein [Amaricoccus sp.]
MFTRERVPTGYTRAELLSDAAVHVTGVVAALVAVPVLVTLAAIWFGDATTVIAAAVYGASLIAMLVCSAANNMIHVPARKDLLRRIDQSAIYVKIAGSYTPLAVLTGTHAGIFLAGIWGVALAGASMRMLSPARLKWASILLYLGLGWAAAFFGGPLFAELTPTGFLLILVAGSLYTLGVLFFVWERLPFHNTIWHIFVLTATFVLYAAVLVELSERAFA